MVNVNLQFIFFPCLRIDETFSSLPKRPPRFKKMFSLQRFTNQMFSNCRYISYFEHISLFFSVHCSVNLLGLQRLKSKSWLTADWSCSLEASGLTSRINSFSCPQLVVDILVSFQMWSREVMATNISTGNDSSSLNKSCQSNVQPTDDSRFPELVMQMQKLSSLYKQNLKSESPAMSDLHDCILQMQQFQREVDISQDQLKETLRGNYILETRKFTRKVITQDADSLVAYVYTNTC